MRERSRNSWSLAIAARLLAVATLGCSSVTSQPIVGPDGSAMVHVSCGSDQGTCFRLAGEACPTGYELRPALSGYDGSFLVRCRHARAPEPALAAVACASATAPAVASRAEKWPPSKEPWPALYPWPPPETSAAVQPAPSGERPKQPIELDLGY